jgi:CrcB protein
MSIYLWIALGSAIGGAGRYWLSGLAAHRFGETFPWGTLIVNASGSFLVGLAAGLTGPEGRWLVSPTARQFLLAGVFGGYTTFSSFSLQTLNLARDGQWLKAGMNALLSVGICLLAVWLGHVAAAGFNPLERTR